jgi:hypothetical protein
MKHSTGRVGAWRGVVAAVAGGLVLAAAAPVVRAAPALSVTQRLQRLEDTKEIHDLLIRYGLLLDSRDYKGYAALFAKDGVWIGGFGTHRGPAGIEAMLEKYMGPAVPGTRNTSNFHLLTNEVIEVDGNHARAVSKLIFYVKGPEGRPVPQMAGHYDDEFVREEGHWKFSRRVVQGDIPFSDSLAPPKPAE